MERITPELITELKENEIFCFGSNLKGSHGGGAARIACKKFGATWGQGSGASGKTYAIPTCFLSAKGLSQMPLDAIQVHVTAFIIFAKQNFDQRFLVTQIGCGLAGFTPEQIAPLFKEAISVENIYLPLSFIKLNCETT